MATTPPKLSPKMHALLDAVASGTKVIVDHSPAGRGYHVYEVREDGSTWMGRSANSTVRALLVRGFLTPDGADRLVRTGKDEIA